MPIVVWEIEETFKITKMILNIALYMFEMKSIMHIFLHVYCPDNFEAYSEKTQRDSSENYRLSEQIECA